MEVSAISYVRSADGKSIAYRTLGGGGRKPLVVPAASTSSIEFCVSDDDVRPWYERASRDRMVVVYDRRGAGMSDHPDGIDDYPVTAAVDDLRAVLSATVDGDFDLWGEWQGARPALELAKTEPRVKHIVLWRPAGLTSMPRGGTRIGAVRAIREAGDFELWAQNFAVLCVGPRPEAQVYERELHSSLSSIEAFDGYQRASASVPEFDPSGVDCPVMILSPDTSGFPAEETTGWPVAERQLAQALTDARIQPLRDTLLISHLNPPDRIWEVVEPFLDGDVAATEPPLASGFQTILFTDLEASTALTQRLGDEGAQELLRGHNASVRGALDAHGGREVKHTGDGIMASFPSAVAAVTAALQIQRDLAGGEVRVRVGLNAGEPIAEDDDLFGTSVILAARVTDRAEPGQVLVTRVVADLCAGKGFDFTSIGGVTLKGFDEAVELFEVS